MSRVCDATGVGPMFGGSRQHNRGKAGGTSGPWAFKAQRTLKKWKPNLRKVKVKIDGSGTTVTLSMKAYKKLKEDKKVWLETKQKFATI
jgi:ribosomal protein L28